MGAGRPSTDTGVEGIDHDRVTAWMAATIARGRAAPDLRPDRRRPVQPDLPGRPTRAGRSYALRRPPVQPRPAHRPRHEAGVHRDHRPRPDRRPGPGHSGSAPTRPSTGALLRHGVRRGPHPARRARAERGLRRGRPARRRATHMVDTLAALHAVDVDAVGPRATSAGTTATSSASSSAGTGSSTRSQVEGVDHGPASSTGSTTCWPPHPRAAARRPSSTATTGSTTPCSTTTGNVRAILDWEICTLGDPLADLGLLMVYWAEPERRRPGAARRARRRPLPGFSTRAEILEPATPTSSGSRRLPASTTTSPSATGSWPASSRASTPATRRGRGRRPRQRRRSSPPRSGDLGETGPAEAWSRPVSPERDPDRDLRGRPRLRPGLGELDRPSLVVALEGWVDAGTGRHRRPSPRCSDIGTDRAGGHLRRRALARPAGPAPGGPHRQRRDHRADLAPHRACARAPTSRGRHAVPGRPRARLPLARLHRRRGGAGPLLAACAWWSGSAPSPRRRPTPARCGWPPPRRPESAELTEQVGIVQGELEVPAGVQAALELAFGANADARRQPVGPGAATTWRPCPTPRPARP